MDSNKQNNLNGGLAFFIMITTYLFLSFLGQIILAALGVENSTLYYAISGLFSSLAIFGVLFYLSKKSNTPALKMMAIQKFNPIYIILAVILSVGMFCGVGFINGSVATLIESIGLNAGGAANITVNSVADLLIYTLVLAILPAVLEECFFRGVMLGSLSGKVTGAVVSVAVIFALYHNGLAQFFYQLVYGISLCVLALKAKSILPCVLAHFLNNFAILLFSLQNVQIDLLNVGIIFFGIALLVMFWLGIFYLDKKNELKLTGNTHSVKELWVPFGVVGASVCVMLIFTNLFA